MKKKFLVDINLPKFFGYFNDESFEFVCDINLKMTDTEIWEYALKNDLIILTKDSDFYNKFLLSENSPKIIYFLIGNFNLKQLHNYFNKNWIFISNEIVNCKIILVKENHFECIK
jgi:predicted nuclease of predicted toxin-antitoxin system